MRYIAADFGAGSGRVIIGSISTGVLKMEEIHRFPNRMVKMGSQLCWDFPYLLQELKYGIKKSCEKYNDIKSIGIDTWGVDFGLIDELGHLIGNPICYRDGRTKGISKSVFEKIAKEKIYSIAGTQIMEINTFYQLAVMKFSNDPKLKIARHLLFMPDLFNYFLTGEKVNEYTIASTSSLLDAATRQWSRELIEEMDLSEDIFCKIVKPGDVIGKLTDDTLEELGCNALKVVAVGSHDTASAAAITFRKEGGTAFLSSGTWSLLGMFIDNPILNQEALKQGITNEGGLNDKILFLKNITGLWLFENLVEEFQNADKLVDYEILLAEANEAGEAFFTIDPDDERFSRPKSMCGVIVDFCKDRNIAAPVTRGQFVRVVLDSLAVKYRQAVNDIENCTGEKIKQIHIVGGGSKNDFLSQLTANATGVNVIAGPVEAAAIGNIVVQAISNNDLKDMDEASEVIKRSFDVKYFQPE